jgi:hypothetical protein
MSKDANIPVLYKKYYVDKHGERKMLFAKIVELYNPQKGIYPGSFVHITPSFFIKEMTYIDNDKRIPGFFKDAEVLSFISKNKIYFDTPAVIWFKADFENKLPLTKNYYDIMFSFYSGFVSQSCKKYLKEDGILVCNNSHGDASIAFLDEEYILTGVIKRNGMRFTITDKNLHTYFRKKDGSNINKAKVLEKMRGENFTKKEYAYVFKLSRQPRNGT